MLRGQGAELKLHLKYDIANLQSWLNLSYQLSYQLQILAQRPQ